MLDVLLTVSRTLTGLDVPHCLIGGLAVSVHGVPRFTDDADFLVSARVKLFEQDLRGLVLDPDRS